MTCRTKISKLISGAFALSVMALCLPAHAHFLWGEVSTDTPSIAKLALSEGPGEVSDGNLLAKIATAKAWNGAGKEIALKEGGGVRSGDLLGSSAFSSSQFYGVLDKTEEGRGIFRLMYYAKAASSLDKAGFDAKLPLEFFVAREGTNRVVATLKRGEVLVTKANVNLHVPNEEKPKILVTDDKGQVHFETKDAGLYGLRAPWIDETPGEIEGKKYPFTRNYTTLSFRVAGAGGEIPKTGEAANGQSNRPTLPPGPNPKADMAAYKLLEGAHNNRQTMPENFSGFTAKVTYKKDGKTSVGNLTYRRQGKTDIKFTDLDEDDNEWIQEKLLNLLGHRRGGKFAEGDGRWPLSFSKLPENSFGKLIVLNDGMKSEYRVNDRKEVTEVTRQMGNTRFTISVLETMPTEGGKYLANHFIVSYRDATTGDLKQLEGYRDNYANIDGVWLPTMRYVFTTKGIKPGEADTPSMQLLRLTDIKILKPETLAANPE